MRRINSITVFGGGNIGTQIACMSAMRGYKVSLLTSKPELFPGELEIVGDIDKLSYCANISLITNDAKKALNNCDVIFVTQPTSQFKKVAEIIEPYINPGVLLGVIPDTGRAEYAFNYCIEKGAVLFGVQRVLGVARLLKWGHTVRVSGLRNKLHLAPIPNEASRDLSIFITDLFGIPCVLLPNYLAVPLTPSNPILHTTRLYSMFKDYKSGVVYDHNILFYEE